MSSKEKAENLVLSFVHVPDDAMQEDSNKAWIDKILAKRCAIICVEQIIEEWEDSSDEGLVEYKNKYFKEVLEHIKNS